MVDKASVSGEKLRMRSWVYSILILALLTAGISPACKFLSGKSLMEICTPWGFETVAAVETPIPFSLASAEESGDEPAGHDGLEQPPCAFCGSKDLVKQNLSPDSALLSVAVLFSASVQAVQDTIIQKARRENNAPRAPPVLFV